MGSLLLVDWCKGVINVNTSPRQREALVSIMASGEELMLFWMWFI